MSLGRLSLQLNQATFPDYKRISDISFYAVSFMVGVIALILIILLKTKTISNYRADVFLIIYTIFVTTFEISRIIGAVLFKSVDSNIFQTALALEKKDKKPFLPKISFVIPCKNEESVIAHTVARCFNVDYPSELLEVIVVNDGSTDRTGKVLKKCQKNYSRLSVIDWRINRGKRNGMAAGFKKAKGEIIIQLDSDSYIEAKDFKNIILPFRNPEVGAVCVHADPANADENMLTKMQAAYYFMSFRILKAAESTFMSVFCCSGCSSVYRKSVVMPILDKWLAETFLGLPVTWGDDRALTNWVIKQNYKTIYTDRAQAYTICPADIKKFIKQQIRWKKGWFVNSIFASRFILKKHKFVSLTYFFPLIFITLVTPFIATRALIINPFFLGISPFYYLAGVFLVAVLIVIFYRVVNRENKYWAYLFIWSGINMTVLSFILFYALATIQDRRWGTR